MTGDLQAVVTATRSARRPRQHQVLHVPEAERVLELLVAGLEAVVRDAAMPLPQRHPELAPGQVRAEAPVHAAPEREVRVDLAVEPNVERVREDSRIDVRGTEADRHERAL